MKIAVIANEYGSLSETFVRRELEALAARDHHIEIFACREASHPAGADPSPLPTHTLDALEDFAPEILYATMGFAAHQFAADYARNHNTPFALRVWQGFDAFTNPAPNFYGPTSRFTQCLGVVVEDEWMRRYAERAMTVAAAVLHVVPNGVNPEMFRWVGSTAPGTPPTILAVGRFVAKKGLDVLIRAAELLTEPGRVLIVGYGPEEERLRQLAGPRVEFRGPVSNEELPALYQQADIFCAPCVIGPRGDADGVPTTVIEAMASGLPVVASDLHSMPWYVKHGITGLLVRPGDPVALAATLDVVLADPQLRVLQGSFGRTDVDNHYDVRENAERIEAVLAPGARPERWKAGLEAVEQARRTRPAALSRYYDELTPKIMAFLDVEGDVLDVGCGDGRLRPHIACSSYVGIDPMPYPRSPVPRWFYQGRGEELPFPAATFDTVLANSVLQHVEDPLKWLQEAHRVLRPGGRVALQVTLDKNPVFLWWWDHEEVLMLLVRAGFNLVDWRGLGNEGQFLVVNARRP